MHPKTGICYKGTALPQESPLDLYNKRAKQEPAGSGCDEIFPFSPASQARRVQELSGYPPAVWPSPLTPHSHISGISTELSQAWAGCAPGLAPSLCTASEFPLFASHFPSHGPWTLSLHSKGRCGLQPSNTANGYGLLEHGTRADSSISKAAHRNNKLSPFLQTRQSVHFSNVRHTLLC